jgi:hypothetical protein
MALAIGAESWALRLLHSDDPTEQLVMGAYLERAVKFEHKQVQDRQAGLIANRVWSAVKKK